MDNSTSDENKIATIESLIPKRQIDNALWKSVLTKARGSENDKLDAIGILFKNHYSLPEESADLLKKLCSPEEPQIIRLRIATSLTEKENEKLPYGLYLDLISILRYDSDAKVKEISNKLYKEKFEGIVKIMKAYSDMNKRMVERLQFAFSSTETLSRQLSELYEKTRIITIPRLDIPPAGLLQMAELAQQWNSVFSKQLLLSVPSFYSVQELKVVGKNIKLEEQSLACKYKLKLELCHKSDDDTNENDWRLYQKTCKDILLYSVVPPLLDPFEEEPTASTGGTQRRDLIFHIPHEVEGFWQWVSLAHHSLALIVECKNYGKDLPANQVIITSKYFGPKRLGNFGIILTRKGLSQGAIAEQKRLWVEDDKMILCLNDEDLTKMVELKEQKEEPSKVIDDAIRSFRQSLA